VKLSRPYIQYIGRASSEARVKGNPGGEELPNETGFNMIKDE